MKIHILGGGPAGLYFAILMKARDPRHEITVVERDGPNDTFGWGIVFSERTLSFLQAHDARTYEEITHASQTWDHVDVVHRGQRLSVRGNGFSGIARLTFLEILHRRCEELGVRVAFDTAIATPVDLEDCDLLLGADGANSLVRRTYQDFFQPMVEIRRNRYIWLGTTRLFQALTMIFRSSDTGLFIAHAYKFSAGASTFIVECGPETWARSGFDRLSDAEACETLGRIFKDDLEGHPLLTNNFVKWLNFPLVRAKRWHHRHIALAGDAAHTAHFSIGSGTKLALEDAIALAGALHAEPRVEAALPAYQRSRKPAVDRFQAAAIQSLSWLEGVDAHLHLPPLAFTYKLMMRSNRVGRARLRAQDADFVAAYERWRAAQPRIGTIPWDFVDLFRKPAFGHLATLMPDGTPHVTPVWVDYDGSHVLVNSAAGRQKDVNMGARPDVAIEIPDPDNPNRYVHVRGRVVEITESGAEAHLDRLAQRYLGRDSYPPSWRFSGEVRRIYKIAPTRVSTWDPFG